MTAVPRNPRIAALLLGLAIGVAAAAGERPVPEGMVRIPAGVYRPFFRAPADPATEPVPAFDLDARPVTHGDFLRFVRENPAWRRSRVPRLFADATYLKSWAGDLELGAGAPGEAPVTFVSWFAARAYARWCGRRLPTLAEWEYAASGTPAAPEAANDPIRSSATGGDLPGDPRTPANRFSADAFGVRALKGLVWEWVADFNTAMVTGDARGDTGLDRDRFCGAGAQGARDPSDFAAFMRFGFRSSLKADYCIHNLGFRCARDP